MSEKVFQKFCRECYTTTPHKVVEVTDSNSVRTYEKIICLKCAGARAYKKAIPKKKEFYEDLLNVLNI